MNASLASSLPSVRPDSAEQLRLARQIIRTEAEALTLLIDRLGDEFCQAVDTFFACRGSVIVTGMGKAGLIGAKLSATFASTGTRSHYLHPGEAVHGDLGRIDRDDAMLILSKSGETEEVVRLLPSLAELQVPVVAMTARPCSALARQAAITLDLGPLQEACSNGLAPSTSTTAMLALGDALALVTSQQRGFSPEDFALRHPGGSLGRKLAKVQDAMRPIDECRVANDSKTVREIFVEVSYPGRRSGAILLTDSSGKLTGIFTDSDLSRLFEDRCDSAIDEPIHRVMSTDPATIPFDSRLLEAIDLLTQKKISELPVIDGDGRPLGIIDITDVVGLLPKATLTIDNTSPVHSSDGDSDPIEPGTIPFPKPGQM